MPTTREKYLSKLKKWSKESPGKHERTVMMKECGKQCFLGTHQSFPICKKNTCSMRPGGIQSAYIRAREMVNRPTQKHPRTYYSRVAHSAKILLSLENNRQSKRETRKKKTTRK
jgi:hypothetical protein